MVLQVKQHVSKKKEASLTKSKIILNIQNPDSYRQGFFVSINSLIHCTNIFSSAISKKHADYIDLHRYPLNGHLIYKYLLIILHKNLREITMSYLKIRIRHPSLNKTLHSSFLSSSFLLNLLHFRLYNLSQHVNMKLISFLVIFLSSCSVYSQSDTVRIKELLIELTKTAKPRNYQNIDQLNETAQFIYSYFRQYADTVFYQTYLVNGITYGNVVARFGDTINERLVIGAHYDVCGNQEGADDNASGIIGLLELARMLREQHLRQNFGDEAKQQKNIELVAYTLEEPPFFRTKYMGSFIHAQSLKQSNAKISGMICLEMIGYFNEAKHTQDYPIGFLKLFYGSRGNYITVVNKFSKGKAARNFTRRMDRFAKLPVKKFNSPKSLTGIDFSDHLNYWKMGFSACMVTDTAFYRNKNYHQKTDEMGTLTISKMALVIDGIFFSILA